MGTILAPSVSAAVVRMPCSPGRQGSAPPHLYPVQRLPQQVALHQHQHPYESLVAPPGGADKDLHCGSTGPQHDCACRCRRCSHNHALVRAMLSSPARPGSCGVDAVEYSYVLVDYTRTRTRGGNTRARRLGGMTCTGSPEPKNVPVTRYLRLRSTGIVQVKSVDPATWRGYARATTPSARARPRFNLSLHTEGNAPGCDYCPVRPKCPGRCWW